VLAADHAAKSLPLLQTKCGAYSSSRLQADSSGVAEAGFCLAADSSGVVAAVSCHAADSFCVVAAATCHGPVVNSSCWRGACWH
jgi:hypothetical protein